jgi:hypothetical protein
VCTGWNLWRRQPRGCGIRPAAQPSDARARSLPGDRAAAHGQRRLRGFSCRQHRHGGAHGGLPETYKATTATPTSTGANLGKCSRSSTTPVRDDAFADALFGHLSSIAVAKDRTLFQDQYNQQSAAIDVGQNHWIDAVSVEQWLAQNPPTGVNTANYTVYFINWYGRTDFKFHVYTKTDTPDPDTGYNFGEIRASRKIVAWGGTPPANGNPISRVWFYDFSAGPESWNGNYDITREDVDVQSVPDYRIPVYWEYGNYRPLAGLTGDAARLARFVAINLLFTTSPLYKPAISPPELPGNINIDVNFYQGDPTSDARDFLARLQTKKLWTAVHNTFTAEVRPRVDGHGIRPISALPHESC